MEQFNIKATELEFKYDVDSDNLKVSLLKFDEFARGLNPEKYVEVASWDSYYSGTDIKLPFEFMRFRQGAKPELTIKRKLDENNNNNRIEIDLPLSENASKDDLKELVELWCQQFGFSENFRLFKYCSIYFYEKVDLVYYIAYNEEMKETGRFIEVEARKDAQFNSPEEAWELVKNLEQKLSIFGITPQHRTRLSQWERNKRK